MTLYELLMESLPRLAALEKTSGITIVQAANGMQSLIHGRLLYRNSDLIAKGDLSLSVGAGGYSATLPTDFISMAGRPTGEILYTDWMCGTVTSYDDETGALVVNVTDSSGSDTLASWNISKAALPGGSSTLLGTSTTSLAVGTGSKSLTTQADLDIDAGDYLIIFPTSLPETLSPQLVYMDPFYLDEDEEHDDAWWLWYGSGGYRGEDSGRPSKYRIIDDTMYLLPISSDNINITGKYFQLPTALTAMTDNLPYRGMFDLLFKEGVVKIMAQGTLAPEHSGDYYYGQEKSKFTDWINREVDTVVNSRIHVKPFKNRLNRRHWI